MSCGGVLMLKTHTGKPTVIDIPPGDYSEPFVLPEGAMLPGSVDESELACGICGDDGTMYDQDADGNDLVVPCVCVETEEERAVRFDRESRLKANLSAGMLSRGVNAKVDLAGGDE